MNVCIFFPLADVERLETRKQLSIYLRLIRLSYAAISVAVEWPHFIDGDIFLKTFLTLLLSFMISDALTQYVFSQIIVSVL